MENVTETRAREGRINVVGRSTAITLGGEEEGSVLFRGEGRHTSTSPSHLRGESTRRKIWKRKEKVPVGHCGYGNVPKLKQRDGGAWKVKGVSKTNQKLECSIPWRGESYTVSG